MTLMVVTMRVPTYAARSSSDMSEVPVQIRRIPGIPDGLYGVLNRPNVYTAAVFLKQFSEADRRVVGRGDMARAIVKPLASRKLWVLPRTMWSRIEGKLVLFQHRPSAAELASSHQEEPLGGRVTTCMYVSRRDVIRTTQFNSLVRGAKWKEFSEFMSEIEFTDSGELKNPDYWLERLSQFNAQQRKPSQGRRWNWSSSFSSFEPWRLP